MSDFAHNRSLYCSLWLVRNLLKYKRLTLEQIRQKWVDCEYARSGNLSRQSFIALRNTAEEILGLVIDCDRRTNEYYIEAQDGSQLSNWLVSTFSITGLASEQKDVRDRILLERPPVGIGFFDLIVEAFREGFALRMKYQKFTDSEPYNCIIEPYCLKHNQQRWYLLARKDHRPYLQTFALDRIVSLEAISDSHFSPEADFSAKEYYADSFGVIVDNSLPEDIVLRVHGVGRDYLRTAPLHASQRERVIDSEVSEFTLKCRPTRDLMLHLLGQGANIEVLKPASIREDIAKEVKLIAAHYSE